VGRLIGVLAVGAALAGCGSGGDDPPAARNTPQDALHGFYAAIIRDHDAGAACRYAAPGFSLHPTNVVGYNVDSAHPDAPPAVPKYRSKPRRGPCAHLVARIAPSVTGRLPWRAWRVESVKVAADGRTADAVTLDGSAGLRLVGGEWRVAWVYDVQ
jgi:hypothetical protein